MSAARDEILKKIKTVVEKQDTLSRNLSREKTIACLVSDFFATIQATPAFCFIALNHLTSAVQRFDRRCSVILKEPVGEEPRIEIHWSSRYSTENNCESITTFDVSTAHFQAALENI